MPNYQKVGTSRLWGLLAHRPLRPVSEGDFFRSLPKRQRRAPIPAQGEALGTEKATAQGLKARPIPIYGLHPRTVLCQFDPLLRVRVAC